MKRRPPIPLFLAVIALMAGVFILTGPRRVTPEAEQQHWRNGSGPPEVMLQPLPATFHSPVFLTAPRGDTSRLFVVEKTGRIQIFKDGAVLPAPFLDLSSLVTSSGERGLLSMAFSPRYARDGTFYVDYTNWSGDTRVVRYRVSADDPDRADPTSATTVLRVNQPYANHNGGQLQFGPDGRLYVGMGDGGSHGDPQGRAQDPKSRLGKMLRLNVDAAPVTIRTYAKGLRNPWRFSFDRTTGALWIGDVGQNAWEEVDYLRPGRPAGANLGWNGYEGTHVYNKTTAATLDKTKLVWPVSQYGHSTGQAVVGGYVYRGGAVSALRGFYVFGDYETGRIWAKNGPGGGRLPLPGADRKAAHISSFGQDAAGELYVVSLDGTVYKVAPAL